MRVSDVDLADYAGRKTYPHMPGDDMRLMALELIAARKVVAEAKAIFAIAQHAVEPETVPLYGLTVALARYDDPVGRMEAK